MVSCIITTFKRDKQILLRAIRSVQNQTYDDIEIIVVNDAPEEIILEQAIHEMIYALNDSRITYIVLESNKGACAARNKGADAAHGAFLAFLDDDDEWLPEKITEQMELMSSENVGLVTCQSYVVRKNGKKKISHTDLTKHSETELEDLLMGNYLGGVSFPLIRKDIFYQAGKFDEGIKSSQDVDLWIRIRKIAEFRYCLKPLLNYYISDESITTNINAKRQGYEVLLRKYKADYEDNPHLLRKKYLNIGNAFITAGEWGIAQEYYNKAKKKNATTKEILKSIIRGELIRLKGKILN